MTTKTGNLDTFPAGRCWLRFAELYEKEDGREYPRIQVSKELGILTRLLKQYAESVVLEYVEAFFLAREAVDGGQTNSYNPGPFDYIARMRCDVFSVGKAISWIHEAEKKGLIKLERR